MVSVSDTGVGIPNPTSVVIEPFFTTKEGKEPAGANRTDTRQLRSGSSDRERGRAFAS
jgi:hypothetical protein